MSVSVRVEELGSRWTDFQQIWHLWICCESVEKIYVE
jgi:hypothetical protein